MSGEFATILEQSFELSPSPSEADNCLTKKLLEQLKNPDNTTQNDRLTERCLLAWQTKKLPRYLISDKGEIIIDNLSGPLWSPAFYRIEASLQHLETKLKGKTVLDPFAGSGSMIHTLMSLNIPTKVFLNDICYQGGKPIHTDRNKCYFYYPELNLEEYKKIFHKHRSYIKEPPLFNQEIRYSCFDTSGTIPYKTGQFDWIFTDPPYGRSMGKDMHNLLINCLPEMTRVTRNGVLAIIPEHWIPIINNTKKYHVDNLTGTLAHAKTVFKTALTHIY
jgi:16S rRNA G966 N2-methylase RsmD